MTGLSRPNPKASPCSAPPWGMMRSSRASFGVSAMTRTGSSSAFPPSMTCRRGGSSCAPAPPPARTTFCASSPLTSRPSTPRSMMQLSLGASQRCWNKGTPPCRPGASTLPGLPSGSEGSVSAPLLPTASQRTGPLGATRCP